MFHPEYRRKTLYGRFRRYLAEVIRRLAEQMDSRVEPGHLMPDHMRTTIAIAPKYAVSQVAECIKGKSAILLARVYRERRRDFVRQHFRARGDCVSTGARRGGDP